MSTLSTHVLDTAAGRPAAGVVVRLETRDGRPLGEATTDADGRVGALGPDSLDPGDYALRFDTGSYVRGLQAAAQSIQAHVARGRFALVEEATR